MRPLPNGEPWGDYAVSTARWTGARLSDVLAQAGPAAAGVEVRFEGADHGAYLLQPVLPETDAEDLGFDRSLPLALATDPASEILIAYAMNGEPLDARPRRALPADRAALVRGRVGEVADAHRRADSSRSSASSRPATTCSSGPTARTSRSRSCASARGSPNPRPARCSRPAAIPSGARRGPAPARSPGRGERRRAKAIWHAADLQPPTGPYHWQEWSFDWDATAIGRQSIRARATDAAGNTQPEVPPWNRLGYGNNAVEVIVRRRALTSPGPPAGGEDRARTVRDTPAWLIDAHITGDRGVAPGIGWLMHV